MKKLIAFAGFAFVAAAAYYAIPQEQVVHNDQAEATLIIVAPSQGGNEYITLHESRSNIHWTAHSEQGRSTRGMVTFNRKNPDVSQSKAAASGLLSTVFERVDATVASSKDPDIRKLEGHPYFSLLLIEGIETRTVPILNFQQLKVLSLEFDSLIDPTERAV